MHVGYDYHYEITKHNYTCNRVQVVSSYKESCNNMPIYGYMLPNLSPSPNLYKYRAVFPPKREKGGAPPPPPFHQAKNYKEHSTDEVKIAQNQSQHILTMNGVCTCISPLNTFHTLCTR